MKCNGHVSSKVSVHCGWMENSLATKKTLLLFKEDEKKKKLFIAGLRLQFSSLFCLVYLYLTLPFCHFGGKIYISTF